ncbi:ABC transporter permease [Brevibacterium casei]|uniref:ABC transporter permease n=1 Tax=Brevibacterium casei TaxID=33889 RepID=UPI00223AF295|nr:ABC transporter permease [Brevibacterium casei]MCT1549641.1 ABC transporter permease [Brevibacterium casei]MCT1559178.1 ABC transporter permease [Brevibacterium casei]MCT2207606.1 ABC transporter permease [Brevibacterium casei]
MNIPAVLVAAGRVSLSELRTIYTFTAFVAAVILRLGFLVVFFWLLARSIGGGEYAAHVLLGNGVALIAAETLQVSNTAVLEQTRGTIPHMVASRVRVGTVFLTRGLHWALTGLVAALIVLLGSTLLDDANWTPLDVLAFSPILILITISTYVFGVTSGAISVLYIKSRGIVSSTAFFALVAFTGVNVAVEQWPQWVENVAAVLPLRWGLAAVRGVVNEVPADVIAGYVVREAVVAGLWIAVAIIVMNVLTERGRHLGTLDRVA